MSLLRKFSVWKKRLCSVALLTIAGCVNAPAQTADGAVAGRVLDPSGARIAGALLRLTHRGTNTVRNGKSDSSGLFRFNLVPPGAYRLEADVSGFSPLQVEDIVVRANSTTSVPVSLTVAGPTTTIDVREQDLLLQMTAEEATSIRSPESDDVPLPTRNVFDLIFSVPQATPGMDGGPAVGGTRQSSINYRLNGADNNYNFAGTYNISPPLASIGELTIVSNSMGAQYGRAGGTVVNISQKSGENTVHGSLYEFHRNRSLATSDFFSNRAGTAKPPFNRNQFGGAIGGPLQKNKTFWYGAYDRIAVHTSETLQQIVPTAAELSRMLEQAAPIARRLIEQLPPPTSDLTCTDQGAVAPNSIGHLGCVTLINPQPSVANAYYSRLDRVFGDSDHLALLANVVTQHQRSKYGGGYLSTAQPIGAATSLPGMQISLSETHALTAHALGETTLSWSRGAARTQVGTQTVTGVPSILIDDSAYGYGSWGIGPYPGGASSIVEDRAAAAHSFTWTKNRHTLKFGGEIEFGNLYRNWDVGAPGLYRFANTFGPTAAGATRMNADGSLIAGVLSPDGAIGPFADYSDSNFVHDLPYFEQLSLDLRTGAAADAYRHYTYRNVGAFVQDDFRISGRATLNLGLRWERFQAPVESRGAMAQFTNWDGSQGALELSQARVGAVTSMWDTPNRNFGPRAGVSYDLSGTGHSSIRAGYGITYDRLFDNAWSNSAWNPPFYGLIGLDASKANSVYYSVPISPGPSIGPSSLPTAEFPMALRTIQRTWKDASSQNIYVGLEHQLGIRNLLSVSYHATLGRHLPVIVDANRLDGMQYNATLTPQPRPNPLYDEFNYRSSILTSNYNGMVAAFTRDYSRGLGLRASYTWSHLLDYGSEIFGGESLYGALSQPYYFVSNAINRKYEYGPAAYDRTHSIKVEVLYDVPSPKYLNHLGAILRGWKIAAIYQGYSGHPLEIYNSRPALGGDGQDRNGNRENVGGDYNLDQTGNDRPDYLGSAAKSAYSRNSPADGIFTDNNPIGCGFSGMTSTNAAGLCEGLYGVTTPNRLFGNPAGYGPHYGALGRNVFRGPWFHGMNAALHRNLRPSEGIEVQLRAEVFNVLNHPNFDGICTDLASSVFGRATVLAGNDATETAASREIQVGIRLRF